MKVVALDEDHWARPTSITHSGNNVFLLTLRIICYHVNSYNAIGVVTKATAGTMAFLTFRAVGYLVVFARALI